MKNDAMSNVKLKTDALENIKERLQKLVAVDNEISELAYAGNICTSGGCSCKDGCTSW